MYQCTAENEHGMIASATWVHVRGKYKNRVTQLPSPVIRDTDSSVNISEVDLINYMQPTPSAGKCARAIRV